MTAPRVRFAPSPTGYLHVGGARTALFNWLYARHEGGTFVLRIEDTDRTRHVAKAVEAIYAGLRWLGLDWDEGPYFQSEREEIYRRHFERLRDGGHLYEDHGAWRFRSPREIVVVDDIICGRIEFDLRDPATHPDITIRRPDGSWIFHFVNVVDDLEMRISHVIRGEDHLSNTPKHLELFKALGAAPPRYAHIPLILNKDGTKMSKRDQGAQVGSYVEAGFAPEAVRNYLCLLGWSPKDDREKLPIAEVVERFDLAKVNRKSAVFDLEKCAWLSGEYFREMEPARFREMARPFFNIANFDAAYVEAALDTCYGKVRTLRELPDYAGFYFNDTLTFDPAAVAKQFVPENKPRLEALRAAFAGLEVFDAPAIEAVLKSTAAALGVKVGVLVHPTRLATTGKPAGPSLYHLLEVLGRNRVQARIDDALARFFA